MIDDVLFFDTGQDLLGIYSLNDDQYVAYIKEETRQGVERLLNAREVVFYGGKDYDMKQLRAFLGADELVFEGVVVDMKAVAWPNIRGSCLPDTYLDHFRKDTIAHFTTETDNERDCYMVYKLWERWKTGTLDIGGTTIMNPIQD